MKNIYRKIKALFAKSDPPSLPVEDNRVWDHTFMGHYHIQCKGGCQHERVPATLPHSGIIGNSIGHDRYLGEWPTS